MGSVSEKTFIAVDLCRRGVSLSYLDIKKAPGTGALKKFNSIEPDNSI